MRFLFVITKSLRQVVALSLAVRRPKKVHYQLLLYEHKAQLEAHFSKYLPHQGFRVIFEVYYIAAFVPGGIRINASEVRSLQLMPSTEHTNLSLQPTEPNRHLDSCFCSDSANSTR